MDEREAAAVWIAAYGASFAGEVQRYIDIGGSFDNSTACGAERAMTVADAAVMHLRQWLKDECGGQSLADRVAGGE